MSRVEEFLGNGKDVPAWLAAVAISALCAASSLSPTMAQESKSAVDTCMTALTPQERKIYDDVAKETKTGGDLRDTIRTHFFPLVRSGQIDRQTALNAAQKVVNCLKQNGR